MPASTCTRAAARTGRWVLPVALVTTLALGHAGCRSMRCQQVSDEAVALARQLSLQGMDAQQRGHWDEAETLFANAVIACPRDERARCGYAEALWHRGDHGEAVKHMEEAVRLSGHDPERVVQLGHMHREQGDLARASELAERAIAANAQLSSAWALRGEVERASGQRAEALASFHRALSLEPHFPPVQLAVAEIYMSEERPQRALAVLQSLAASFPVGQAPPDLLILQSVAFRSLGRYSDAARMLAAVAERGRPSPELLCELARTQHQAGEDAAAAATLATALAQAPQHPIARALERELYANPSVIAAARQAPGASLH